ncbi:transposable element Tcb1 transposase [Trichonephila clavipes]|nr:transposable element Tcb1 transposase [Trichonephila clavipes]
MEAASGLSHQLSVVTGSTVSRQTMFRGLGHIGLYVRRPVTCVPLMVTHCLQWLAGVKNMQCRRHQQHVWGMLGRRVAARYPPPTCAPELRRALLAEWSNLSQDQLDNLLLSMYSHCTDCISSLG